jgi:hypothetical protein
MTFLDTAIQFRAALLFFIDKKNNTTGPAHYTQPIANKLIDAYNKEYNNDIAHFKLDSYIPL